MKKLIILLISSVLFFSASTSFAGTYVQPQAKKLRITLSGSAALFPRTEIVSGYNLHPTPLTNGLGNNSRYSSFAPGIGLWMPLRVANKTTVNACYFF